MFLPPGKLSWLTVGAVLLLGAVGALPSAWAEEPTSDKKLSFTRDVIPALTKSGCNAGACHGSFQGRGGFRLSLLGFDPAVDYDTIFKAGRGRRVTPTSPEQSLLLRKATA